MTTELESDPEGESPSAGFPIVVPSVVEQGLIALLIKHERAYWQTEDGCLIDPAVNDLAVNDLAVDDLAVDATLELDGRRYLFQMKSHSHPTARLHRYTRLVTLTLNRIPRISWVLPSAQSLTDVAISLVGSKRPAIRAEWRDHLSGETGTGLLRQEQYRAALGFLYAALRYRCNDLADLAWRPVDTVLRSRTLSNLVVLLPTAAAAAYIVHGDGALGAVASAESLSAVGGLLYGLIRVGRWWRNVKPPEPRARRAKDE